MADQTDAHLKTREKTPAEHVGHMIASLTPLGLMTWAAVEVDGVLRAALIAWIILTLVCIAAAASGWRPQR